MAGYHRSMQRHATATICLGLVLSACPGTKADDEGPATCEASLDEIREDILVPNCTGDICHDADNPAAGLNFTLSSDAIETQLVGIPSAVCADWTRVVPGDPEQSILFAKLHDPPPCGERMPIDGELSDMELACIGSWISSVESSCETCGGELCVDLTADAQHCGACDNACPESVACVVGACMCPGSMQVCGDACVDTQSDPQNCGACGEACDPGAVCNAGSCEASCDPGLEQCGGACVDTQSDPQHCGGCDSPCDPGQECDAGSCGCPVQLVSFATQVEPLLVDNCALGGCHAQPQLQLGLDLRAGKAYASLVGVASMQCGAELRVDPGTPGTSYVLDKLRGVDLCDGGQMPLNGTPLDSADIDMISAWICQGALEN